jgi:hypothetical protein
VLLRVALAAVAVLALAACGGDKKRQAAPATTSGLPPGCTVADADRIVQDFLTRPSVAPASTFEVYATNESDGRKFIAHTPAKAVAHLRRRLRLGETSRVIELRVGQQDFNHVRITFQLTRHASDYVQRGIHQRLVRGAGTIDCAHQQVAAWVTKGP